MRKVSQHRNVVFIVFIPDLVTQLVCVCVWGGGGGRTLYSGLYWEAPPEGGYLFLVYERVGVSLVKVYERVGKSVISVSKKAQKD